ncbi:hypothetical protein [Psychroflexus sp. MES1-P1E]|uniref:hypothetical protein n=1 Tax=Psychroflexus sp. MES1-P1E TaxID=2058320 RepID=UPI0015E0D9C6|nr:hypothetical protein [Psychroflexus sp. MES1-P1E]
MKKGNKLAVGIAIGIGTAIGVATDNLGLWLGVGVATVPACRFTSLKTAHK